MKCMHCLVEFHAIERQIYIGKDVDGEWAVLSYECSACGRRNLYLVDGVRLGPSTNFCQTNSKIAIRPFGINRPPCPQEVPVHINEDYKEACLVLPLSSKASAALSRRCLQNLLRDAAKVKPSDLSKEIQEVVDDGKLPTNLAQSIDAIRNIGNFAAHPAKSKNTGEILPVESEEAEWNLDVLESLFDFYYVQPAILNKKRDALNAKLQEAGKPPMK